ncbi:hypothetical protein ACFSGX_04005 [Sphingomonas arantia]|uniref:Uncharacterized protein n=1 Tax=Sphingomonas arantia TaxID=1460676 RepID=A0ABW4TTT7_9SPHN
MAKQLRVRQLFFSTDTRRLVEGSVQQDCADEQYQPESKKPKKKSKKQFGISPENYAPR